MFESMLPLAAPDEYPLMPISRARARLEYSADIAPLRQAVAAQMASHRLKDDDASAAQMSVAVWSHDAAAISRVLSGKHVPVQWNGVVYPDAWFEALAARLRGDNSAALKAFASARPQMVENVRVDPTRGVPLSFLAIVDAELGWTEQAVQEAKRACELSSFKVNNLDAVIVRCNLAIVYAWTGQNERAIADLNKLVDRPAGGNTGGYAIPQASYGDFRLNLLWDPLRNDQRFEALVQRLAPTQSR
jgi:tetratricopeptide (TPR) repeat protein